MRPIPTKIRNTLERMPRMRRCELKGGKFGKCDIGIQWHHVWIYAGKQINEVWAILGICPKHHNLVKEDYRVREAFEKISIELSTIEEREKYPKMNWGSIIIDLFA